MPAPILISALDLTAVVVMILMMLVIAMLLDLNQARSTTVPVLPISNHDIRKQQMLALVSNGPDLNPQGHH